MESSESEIYKNVLVLQNCLKNDDFSDFLERIIDYSTNINPLIRYLSLRMCLKIERHLKKTSSFDLGPCIRSLVKFIKNSKTDQNSKVLCDENGEQDSYIPNNEDSSKIDPEVLSFHPTDAIINSSTVSYVKKTRPIDGLPLYSNDINCNENTSITGTIRQHLNYSNIVPEIDNKNKFLIIVKKFISACFNIKDPYYKIRALIVRRQDKIKKIINLVNDDNSDVKIAVLKNILRSNIKCQNKIYLKIKHLINDPDTRVRLYFLRVLKTMNCLETKILTSLFIKSDGGILSYAIEDESDCVRAAAMKNIRYILNSECDLAFDFLICVLNDNSIKVRKNVLFSLYKTVKICKIIKKSSFIYQLLLILRESNNFFKFYVKKILLNIFFEDVIIIDFLADFQDYFPSFEIFEITENIVKRNLIVFQKFYLSENIVSERSMLYVAVMSVLSGSMTVDLDSKTRNDILEYRKQRELVKQKRFEFFDELKGIKSQKQTQIKDINELKGLESQKQTQIKEINQLKGIKLQKQEQIKEINKLERFIKSQKQTQLKDIDELKGLEPQKQIQIKEINELNRLESQKQDQSKETDELERLIKSQKKDQSKESDKLKGLESQNIHDSNKSGFSKLKSQTKQPLAKDKETNKNLFENITAFPEFVQAFSHNKKLLLSLLPYKFKLARPINNRKDFKLNKILNYLENEELLAEPKTYNFRILNYRSRCLDLPLCFSIECEFDINNNLRLVLEDEAGNKIYYSVEKIVKIVIDAKSDRISCYIVLGLDEFEYILSKKIKLYENIIFGVF